MSLGLVGCLSAQRVVAEVPLGGIAEPPPAPQSSGDDDPGVAVEVVENPDLDRYLRRAQAFLDRQDYAQAIELLQEVIEGRSVEVVADPKGAPTATGDGGTRPPASGMPASGTPASGNGAAGTAKPPAGGAAKPPAGGAAKPNPDGTAAPEPSGRVRRTADARNAVFAANGRLYRPVRRLCHELLARLPAAGIEIYRTNYEVTAEELLRKAENDGSISGLEQVANRYFVTLAAGRAMALLADRLMHEGRYRAAVQVLRDLTEVYPADNRKRIGVNPLWCGFKIALCLRFAGEDEAAHAEATRLAAAHPDESLRLLGELQAVAELPAGKLFARDFVGTAPATEAVSWLDATTTELVPLWQYRFRNPDPFREPKSKANNNNDTFVRGFGFGEGGPVPATMPHPARYGASGWVTFPGESAEAPRALFLEHYRLRAVDALSGLLVGEGAGPDEPPPPREGHPRVRVAAADQALLRPVDDGQRRYVVVGHSRATASNTDALKASTLIAYRRELDREEWSSAQWGDGPGGLRDVTFLAAPTVFGERLLLPALRFGFYSLECLDRRTGKPLWNTPLSGGGSPFFKAPGCPVVVQGGIAFVLTNAGTLAAVDAFSGDLRWIRRYERIDSRRRSTKNKGRPSTVEYSQLFGFAELPGFYPSDLLVRSGLVLLAPVDGEVLLCLDGAGGEALWWIDGGSRHFTQSCGTPRGLVGATDQRAFLLTDTHLVAIDLRGGLLEWSCELPKWNGARGSFRGRGAIVGDFVVLPGQGELLVIGGDGKQPLRRVPLRAFDSSRDPLGGIMSLCSQGPWLAVGYAGGIEMFSTAAALERLARTTASPLRQAGLLVQAGQTAAAIATLRAAIPRTEDQAEARAQSDQLLALVREQALTEARGGALEKGLSALDTILEAMVGRELRLRWHLARIEICKDVGELRAHEREQERLYQFMEGKG